MKRLVLAFFLLPTIALAQQQPQQQPSPAIQTLDSMLHESVEREARDRLEAITAQQQIAALQKQVAAVTAERDKLKPTPPATPPTP